MMHTVSSMHPAPARVTSTRVSTHTFTQGVRTKRLSTAAIAALVAGALAGGTAVAATASSTPGAATADFIAAQLSAQPEDLLPGVATGEDVGLSIDAVFALDALGGHDEQADATFAQILQRADSFYKVGTAVDAGRLAKLVALEASREAVNPEHLSALLSAVQDDGAVMDSDNGAATTPVYNFSQAWTVIALARAGRDQEAAQVADFLKGQQCANGAIPLSQATPPSCLANTDTTALFIQAVSLTDPDDAHIDAAVDFLAEKQQANGGLAAENLGANANTSALAASAFAMAGETARFESAYSYLESLRFGADAPSALRGAFRWQVGDGQGLDTPTNQILRATMQAAVAYAGANYANDTTVAVPSTTQDQSAPSAGGSSADGGLAALVEGIVGILLALGLAGGGLANVLSALPM